MDAIICADIDSEQSSYQTHSKLTKNQRWTDFSQNSGFGDYFGDESTTQTTFTDETKSDVGTKDNSENCASKNEVDVCSTQWNTDVNYTIDHGNCSYGRLNQRFDFKESSLAAIPELDLYGPPSIRHQVIDENRRNVIQNQASITDAARGTQTVQLKLDHKQNPIIMNSYPPPQLFMPQFQPCLQRLPFPAHPVPPFPLYGYPMPYVYPVFCYPPMNNQGFPF